MIDFDELNKNDLGYNGVPIYEKGFEAGQQSQQAKIDQLNKKNSEEKRILHNVIEMNQAKIDELQAKAQMCRDEKTHAISRWSALCKERDELQERVDEALQMLEYNEYTDSALQAIDILKGNKDEN